MNARNIYLTCYEQSIRKRTYENIVRKGENTGYQHLLPFALLSQSLNPFPNDKF